jgi:hypothetical protein
MGHSINCKANICMASGRHLILLLRAMYVVPFVNMAQLQMLASMKT